MSRRAGPALVTLLAAAASAPAVAEAAAAAAPPPAALPAARAATAAPPPPALPAARAATAAPPKLPPPPVWRFHMQVGGAGLFAVHLEIDGKPATERADGGHLHAALGIERRIADRYSLGIEGRFGTWDSTLSRRAQGSDGGLRWGGDAVFRLYMPTAINMSAVVAVAAGLTWPHMLDRPTRAVTESWQGRLGWNAGVDVGGENWFQLARAPVAWAAAFSLGYAIHAMTLDGRFTPVSEPAAAASARYRYLTHEFLLKMTLLVGS